MKAALAGKCCLALIVKVSSLIVQPVRLNPSFCSVAWDKKAKRTVGDFHTTPPSL